MKAELKRLHSPDVLDLRGYVPEDPEKFSFLLQVMLGPEGEEGEESFDVVVCTPDWLRDEVAERDITMGIHYLFMNAYDYEGMQKYIASFCDGISGDSWLEIAQKPQYPWAVGIRGLSLAIEGSSFFDPVRYFK